MDDNLNAAASSTATLPMPTLHRRYPLRRSTHYDAALADEVDTWFLSYGLLTSSRQQEHYRSTNHTYLASVCWPCADRRTLADLARLAAALMARDHAIDSTSHRQALSTTHHFLQDAEHHFTPHPGRNGPWTPLFADLWQRIATHQPERFMNRLAAAIATYLRGCLTRHRMIVGRAQPTDLHTYLKVRRYTIAQHIDHLLTEMSLRIELHHATLTHPLMRRLHDADIKRTILVQDLLSASRELAAGETENVIAVLAAEHNCTPSQALPHAISLFEQAMDAYDTTHRQILDTHLARHGATRAYLNALNDFNSGLIEWTTHSPRYSGNACPRWTTPDEIVHPTTRAAES
ncbi:MULTISPECIES: hypothetical protein [unclassified Streptomyces]|uniref:terpene synthase family protein n=1 Tax=unclassified Streptomyces TaxID=2593676 RepID=UPI0033C7285B